MVKNYVWEWSIFNVTAEEKLLHASNMQRQLQEVDISGFFGTASKNEA